MQRKLPGRSARLGPVLALVLVYLLVAGAAFQGFYDKWGFREGEPGFNAALMLSGQAKRPFVYRRLGPWIANAVGDHIPPALVQKLKDHSVDLRGKSYIGPDFLLNSPNPYFIRYQALYYLCFLELFAALFMLRWLCLGVVGPAAATLAPALFALLLPVLMTLGGFFYDTGELLFLSAAALFAVKRWRLALLLATVLGTANKESFLLFLPSLLPLLMIRSTFRSAAITVAVLIATSAAIYLSIAEYYSGAGGNRMDSFLPASLLFYVNPVKLFYVEKTYGVLLPRGYSLVWLGLLGGIGWAGWSGAPTAYRRHVLAILAINVPFVIAFAYPGEMRNFSLTFVGWTVLAACALQAWLKSQDGPAPAGALHS